MPRGRHKVIPKPYPSENSRRRQTDASRKKKSPRKVEGQSSPHTTPPTARQVIDEIKRHLKNGWPQKAARALRSGAKQLFGEMPELVEVALDWIPELVEGLFLLL